MPEHVSDIYQNKTFRGNTVIGDQSTDTLTVVAAATFTGSVTLSGSLAFSGALALTNTLTVGIDGTGKDVKFYGDTSGSYFLWDESADELVLNAATLQLGGKVKFGLNGGAASASGLLMGVGTSVAPATTAVADSIFAEFRTKSTATSGDSRGIYWRHELGGSGAGGEAARIFAKVTAAATTGRGAHISLDLDAAGSLSGFGAGVDAQLMLGGAAYDDDITVQNLEIYANASATVTGRTSFLRPVIQGDSTAVANVNANAFFIDLSNVTASAVGLLDTDITALTGWAGLRVRCPDGVTRYIPVTTGS